MSTQALALVEDIKARRESALVAPTGPSPFPDFDRMLQNLSGGDEGFSFNLDPKLAGDDVDASLTLPDVETEATTPFTGTYLDAFPGLRIQAAVPPFMSPPGLGYPQKSGYASAGPGSPVIERQSTGSSYTGSFNPFAEGAEDGSSRRFSPLDEDRKMSRFGFARGRHGSSSSPLHTASPLGHHSETVSHAPFYTPELGFAQANATWNPRHPHADYMHHQPTSALSSPLAQHAQAVNYGQSPHLQQQQQRTPSGRFQPFDTGVGMSVSEAQLRDLISASRDRINGGGRSGSTGTFISSVFAISIADRGPFLDPQTGYKYNAHQQFTDPAIMSAQMVSSPMLNQQQGGVRDNSFASPQGSMDNLAAQHQMNYGPPPGLMYPPGIIPGPMMAGRQQGQPLSGGVNVGLGGGMGIGLDASQASGSAHGECDFYLFQGRQSHQVRVPSSVLSVRKLYHRV